MVVSGGIIAKNGNYAAERAGAERRSTAGGCAEHHILADVITQAQDVFGKCLTINHLQSKYVRRSTSVNRLADRLFRETCPTAASKATFAKTIVLGNLHLPCPVIGTCRLVVLVVIGHRHKPKMAITLRKVPVQNGDRLPPDAALRLVRRKRGKSHPRPQSASGLSSSDLERSVRVPA